MQAVKDLLEVGGCVSKKQRLVKGGFVSLNRLDIDARGGPDLLSALQLASQSSLFDIVTLLIDHEADLFAQSIDGKSAFSGVKNNLLMIKLLKKEEKSFFA